MLEEGEGCARGRVRLPSLSLTIYRGKGGGGALGLPRGGAAATGETLDGFGRPHPWETCPQAGRGGCPRGGAPTSPRYVRGVGRGAQPLSGLVCPLPLAHKAPQRLPGPPKPLSVTLVVTRYSQNNPGLQYPSSNISIFTSGPFRSSSSRPGSHPGLRTTFGNHILFPITTLASPNLKCVDPTGSGTMQT